MDWATRYVLAWQLSNTMDASLCVGALDEALGRGKPDIVNTDQGSQFASEAFAGRVLGAGVRFSMDGRGRYLDHIFIERLWRSLKYEAVYLRELRDVADDLDLATLKRLPADWVGEDLRQLQADMLWQARIKDSEPARHMLIHLEFQSKYDSNMTSRMLEYAACARWEQGLNCKDIEARPPSIFPIVVYSGKRRWPSVQPEDVPATASARASARPYELVDLMRLDPEHLSAARFGSLLALIQQADSAERLWELDGAAEDLLTSAGQEPLLETVRTLIVNVRLPRVDPEGRPSAKSSPRRRSCGLASQE